MPISSLFLRDQWSLPICKYVKIFTYSSCFKVSDGHQGPKDLQLPSPAKGEISCSNSYCSSLTALFFFFTKPQGVFTPKF